VVVAGPFRFTTKTLEKAVAMKTKLKNFCLQFSTELDPFTARLDQAIARLAERSAAEGLGGLKSMVTGLEDVLDRARTLQEKVANQHAYLLIFGPLKSGKSTLMNAISGAYVSEVSCLPTYPALVYVKDGAQNRFQAVNYQGEQQEFADSQAMQAAIQRDHAELAEAIRNAEKAGEEFDPATHRPSAIRRVEVELPAPNLGESGTVLVDTPGLYSRMKFGYDQMTRDFRDAAACAIFVVKTDDLFFEKVFEEFEELLSCFSQIFLISNIDSSKQDLQPDGSLHVSLEGSDPGKVIEAFQSLSISAPIQAAIDSGRLNIYTIDLLKAASRRLSARQQAADDLAADAAQETADPDNVAVDNGSQADDGAAGDGFDRFLGDLTGYLNSSDYLTDFMVDTLRAARDLVEEKIESSAEEISVSLREACKELNATVYKERHLLDALSELEKIDWQENFAHLQEEKNRHFAESGVEVALQNGSLKIALEEWMQSDESWQDLIESRLKPLLKQAMRQGADDAVEQLRALLDSVNGGGRFSTSRSQQMSDAGLSVTRPVRELLASLGKAQQVALPQLDLKWEDVPMNLGFLDRLLFRNETKVRQQVFGADGTAKIPAAVKRKRLAGQGVEFLNDALQLFVANNLPSLAIEHTDRVLADYISRYLKALKQQVSSLKEVTVAAIQSNESKLRSREQVLAELDGIRAAAERFAGSLGGIANEFAAQPESPDVDSHTPGEPEAAEALETDALQDQQGGRTSDSPDSELDQDGVVIEEWPES